MPSTVATHSHARCLLILPLGGEWGLLEPGAWALAWQRRQTQRDQEYRAAARAQDQVLHSTPRVETHARRYFLLRGPLDAACSFEPGGMYTSPNLWWPDDCAWIVITEVDGFSTCLGGGRAALQDVRASPDVEAIEASLDAHMDPGGYRPRWR